MRKNWFWVSVLVACAMFGADIALLAAIILASLLDWSYIVIFVVCSVCFVVGTLLGWRDLRRSYRR